MLRLHHGLEEGCQVHALVEAADPRFVTQIASSQGRKAMAAGMRGHPGIAFFRYNRFLGSPPLPLGLFPDGSRWMTCGVSSWATRFLAMF